MDYKDIRNKHLPEESRPRIEKLPNGWIKAYIKSLEHKLARSTEELEIAKGNVKQSNISFRLPDSIHHDNYIPEDSDVRYHLPDSQWIDIRNRNEKIEIMGSDQISVSPRASNHLLIGIID